MANAKQPGGLYVVNGVVVDANGIRVEDPPEIAADTLPSAQPGAAMAMVAKPLGQEIGEAIAVALKSALPVAPVAAAADDKSDGKDPKDKK